MDATLTTDPTEFARAAAAYLAGNAVPANFVATALSRASSRDGPDGSTLWGLVSDRGQVVGAAMVHPPFAAEVGPMAPAAACALVRALLPHGPLEGVSGQEAAAGAFAGEWAERTGCPAHVGMAQGIFVLRDLRAPDAVEGRARNSTAGDVDEVCALLKAFGAEAVPYAAELPYELVASWVSAGDLVIWDSGGIVSLAGVHDPAYGVGRVGPVYTPPAHRGRGYGAAASAVAARRLLDGGAGQVMLFTDLANRTSNRLYRRIGFERVGTATSWIFEPPPPAVTAPGS